MSEHEERAIVRLDRLLALLPFVSTDERHTSLRGVEITPAEGPGCILCATDGTLTVAMNEDGASMSGLPKVWRLPERPLTALAALHHRKKDKLLAVRGGTLWCDLGGSLGKPSRLRLVQADTSSAVLAGGGTEIGCIEDKELGSEPLMIGGEFSAWRQLMVASRPQEATYPVWVGAANLVRIAVLASALDGKATRPGQLRVAIHCGLEDKAARVTILGYPEVAILLMRAWPPGPVPIGNPDWVDALYSDQPRASRKVALAPPAEEPEADEMPAEQPPAEEPEIEVPAPSELEAA